MKTWEELSRGYPTPEEVSLGLERARKAVEALESKISVCPACGGKTHTVRDRDTRCFGSLEVTTQISGFQCNNCNEIFYSYSAMMEAELSGAYAVATAGLLDGESLRFRRKAIGLPLAIFANLCNCSEAYAKMTENGDFSVPTEYAELLNRMVMNYIASWSRT